MVMMETNNLNVRNVRRLTSPNQLKEIYPLTEEASEFVTRSRETIKRILDNEDDRLMAVVGPCSIHDPEAALDYARRLAEFQSKVEDQIFLVMRVYFEKPRTTIGWKGLINDPELDGTHNIGKGIATARELLCNITKLGVPIAGEMLDMVTPQFLADHISWGAIGARTTEAQTHRELASGLSFPIGFKNGTDGNLDVAIDGIEASMHPHSFLGVDRFGRASIVDTDGNQYSHIVLRGGKKRPNYEETYIRRTEEELRSKGLTPSIMVDCSHANSGKKHKNQRKVLENIVGQVYEGNTSIRGLMIESNLKPGNQKLKSNPSELEYGVSITDECSGIEETEEMLMEARNTLQGKSSRNIFAKCERIVDQAPAWASI